MQARHRWRGALAHGPMEAMGEAVQPVTLGKRRVEEDTDSGTGTAAEGQEDKGQGEICASDLSRL